VLVLLLVIVLMLMMLYMNPPPRRPRSQTLFGNALVFETLFRGWATELPGQWHSQTEFGNEKREHEQKRDYERGEHE
jgi:hypothetical protein